MTYRLYEHDTSPALNTRIINSNIYRKNYWIINYTAREQKQLLIEITQFGQK